MPTLPPPEARDLALRAAKAIGLDLAGVDLVERHDGSIVVLEVNGAVDFTPEYGLEGSDPFAEAVRALVAGLERLDEVSSRRSRFSIPA